MSIAPTPVRPGRSRSRLRPVLTSLLALLLAAILVVLLIDHHSSQRIVGSGVSATQARSLPPFTSVDVTVASKLDLRVGGRQSVVVRADDNILGRITTRVASGRLVIGNQPGRYSFKTPVLVRVVVPSVTAVTLEGSGDVTASNIRSSMLTLSLDGFGMIRASGTTVQLRVTINGAGQAQLAALRARNATAVVNGAGEVTVTATDSLQGIIVGTGAITYLGSPRQVTRSIAGNGEITPG
jgi:Putative auto-transporter adhesin, head GIN domain